ncbi:hypothetical protein KIH74_09350 [Kineosporia sp. J2-2]|uniref:Uncharacterized protein n=1 Tax=Kineosporia corallincola TaxID=2835133 RepID=A0ABS5TGB5_9ACTN|nr:hypothetical protein [Kineosporia corallincola]MBT0769123.1 hypothetical protein [Kineosporia corallincola]
MSKEPERWHLSHDGHEHTVEISPGTSRRLRWTSDGTEVASKKTSDNTVVLDGHEHGAIRLKLPTLPGPARQVTLYTPGAQLGATGSAHAGVGGTDFVPEEGSRAARRETWIRDHPYLYTARRTGTALAGVLLPIALIWLLKRITWRPDINLPTIDLPRIPWPHIDVPWPEINLPDLPNLPNLPDLPDLPGWSQYVWPVLLAFGVARAELRRRRQQDEKRRAAALEAPEPKQANDKEPGRSRPGQEQPGVAKPDRPKDDTKTTQACRVESAATKPS